MIISLIKIEYWQLARFPIHGLLQLFSTPLLQSLQAIFSLLEIFFFKLTFFLLVFSFVPSSLSFIPLILFFTAPLFYGFFLFMKKEGAFSHSF